MLNQRKEIMADYFTNFSLVLTLPNEEARKYALDPAERPREEEIDLSSKKRFGLLVGC